MAEHVADLWEGGVLAQLASCAESAESAEKEKEHLEGARPSDGAWKILSLRKVGDPPFPRIFSFNIFLGNPTAYKEQCQASASQIGTCPHYPTSQGVKASSSSC